MKLGSLQDGARRRAVVVDRVPTGTISNESYRTVGSACIAERRGIELTIFGAIDQRIVEAPLP